ncbi:MAG: flagellar biosynthesis anti-sigma factor FlgM [Bdellovibrionales bacterium RIFCSPHIGHO2_01_FULL_40_29]|nr:MAG: flagellar biosynthesis anti-sigma factor FlgM [Bdellovibrionales bacterium RIFCSPHIGHO2_01_FULL_40_29]OFZ34112.1 MAG: flagellar biosynthesis anti-sigma factor FlgM [Bdellovibrionales bacterium RIFCSPHIGHO2_02_FULL_40_15]
MKITHNKIGQNLNLTDSKLDKASDKNKTGAVKNQSEVGAAGMLKDLAAASGNDAVKVDISERSHDIQRIKDLAKASPDVDQAKVDKFRKLIDEGKYKVDAKAVADKMVDEQLMSMGTSNE